MLQLLINSINLTLLFLKKNFPELPFNVNGDCCEYFSLFLLRMNFVLTTLDLN